MKDVSIECTLSLPSEEYLKLYYELAEDGRLGDFLSQAFMQAANMNNAGIEKVVDAKIGALEGKLESMQNDIASVIKAIASNPSAISLSPVISTEKVTKEAPVEVKDKPVIKRRKSRKANKPMGGGLAALTQKSQAMNSVKRRDD